MKPLPACVGLLAALVGVLDLELQAAPAMTGNPAGPIAAVAGRGAGAAVPPDETALVQAILRRPLFTPGRAPALPVSPEARLPRLAGLVLTPGLHLALLQSSDADGLRPLVAGQGAEIAGWRVVRVDAAGVLLRRQGQTVALSLRPAAARASAPTPIDQIVLMAEKHINPQLAW